MRFVAPDAKLSVMEVKWGLVPDMGGFVLMRGLVRDDIARELVFSGRVFDGAEALGLGLAPRVCDDPRSAALAFAKDVAARSPDAIRAAKRLFALAAEGDQHAILLAETAEQVNKNHEQTTVGMPPERIEQSKSRLKDSIRNVRAGLDQLESSFKLNPVLQTYYPNIAGVAKLGQTAEGQAVANSFDQSGRSLLAAVNKLTDALVTLK